LLNVLPLPKSEMSAPSVDLSEAMIRLSKYLLEGGTVGFASYFIPAAGRKPKLEEVLLISVVAAATFSVIDLFAPSISPHARQGAGFGIGASLYSWPK
jgi:hypothetical protein